ncbi:protein-glutamate O-methyltransferase CheR [Pseudoruegeria sp. HB172150]|uniref:CheR family methyltransferase n=1 Tax=Pseudoruegeria sp. HB172150 TaxID=2721164 RepID=UPI0015568781|nr:protein-glutamate O-methyltransferase CheR [Pseudoruegeria sp. HB172150]
MNEPLAASVIQNASTKSRELSLAEFHRIADLLLREAGIELTESKLPLVHSRLSGRLRSLGLTTYRAYCDFIEGIDGETERLEMLSVLTTNVTRFFREPHHFDYLRQHMIPELRITLQSGGSVRIWSAGCASGEEPYTLALTFLQEIPDIARYDFRILASDIDPAILQLASAGTYSSRSLAQVPQDQKDRYFRPCTDDPDSWQVGSELQSLITFRRLNLIGEWPFKRKFDVIMCRNVVIYFGAETKAAVWKRFVENLHPGGWLITGHSERLTDCAATLTEPLYTTTYRRREATPRPKEEPTCH